jgi:hypothetical protein
MADNIIKEWLEMSITQDVLHVISEKEKMMKNALMTLETLVVNSAYKGRYSTEETIFSLGQNNGDMYLRFILKRIICKPNHSFYQIWVEDVKKEKREIVLSFHVRNISFSYLTFKNTDFSECDNHIKNILRKIQTQKIQDKEFLDIANILLSKLDPLSKLLLISTSYSRIQTIPNLNTLTSPKKRGRDAKEGPEGQEGPRTKK